MSRLFSLLLLGVVALPGAGSTQPSMLWSHTYGQTGLPDFCQTVIRTLDGGFMIGGMQFILQGEPHGDYWLVKTDGDGELLDEFSFGGPDDQEGIVLAAHESGDIFLAGEEEDPEDVLPDAMVVKRLTASGDIVWSTTLSQNDNDLDFIIATSDGGVLALGDSFDGDAWVVKLDGDGAILWDITFGEAGTVDNVFYGIETTGAWYALVGESSSFGPVEGEQYPWLLKVRSNGDVLGNHTYGEAGGTFEAIVQTADGGYAMVGRDDNGDALTIKADGEFQQVWEATYGGAGTFEALASVHETPGGDLLLTGIQSLEEADFASYDPYIVRTSADGSELWTHTFEIEGTEIFRSLLLDDGSLVFGGMAGAFPTDSDGWLARTNSLVDVDERPVLRELPSTPLLLAAYPNPFNSTARVTLRLESPQQVDVELLDLLGRRVAMLASGERTAGEHAFSFDAGPDLASGMYLLRARTASGRQESRRITLLR